MYNCLFHKFLCYGLLQDFDTNYTCKAFAHLKVSANFALDKRNSARFYAGSFRYAPLVTTYI